MSADRRVFLLYGWGRYLASSSALVDAMRYVTDVRPRGNFGVLVDDDRWAGEYQRLYFRLQRAKHAFGAFGLSGLAVYGSRGWEWKTGEHVRQLNSARLHEYRVRAHEAKRRNEERRSPVNVVHDHRIENEVPEEYGR